jgi:DegV family protein with EDD domain
MDARIAIVTDSTCDIPERLIDQYGIIVVPQVVIWGTDQYLDRVDLQPAEFYRRLVTDEVQPHSSLPAQDAFQEAYQSAIGKGAQGILVLTISSAMSGTYELARTAAQQLNVPATVIDAMGPTMSLGWQVLAAARARDAGADLSGMAEQAGRVRARLAQFVAMDSLEHLQRGGRIGHAVKWVGMRLRVRPVVSINHETGTVEPAGLARTHAAVIDMLYTKFFEAQKGRRNLHIAVLHGNVPTEAEALADRIRNEHHPLELLINCTGPVLGINTGPGALALCGYSED